MAAAQLIVKTQSQLAMETNADDSTSDATSSLAATHVDALVINLSEKTKVTAHPGNRWKTGYLTVSRASQVKSGWRNVHVSKKSFEKLGLHLSHFQDAVKAGTEYQQMLTKKQHVLTSRFSRQGKDTLHYVSLMHPVKEQDAIKPYDDVNHSKTINLNVDEFEKFCEAYEKLSDVVKSKTNIGENDEVTQLVGYRWTHKKTGDRCPVIFLSLKECESDSTIHYFQEGGFQGQPMDYEYQGNYDYYKVPIDRPMKMEVIEHLAYRYLYNILITMDAEAAAKREEKTISSGVEQFNYYFFKVLVKKVLTKLSYKNVYLTGELVDMFAYMGCMEKVKTCLQKREASVTGKIFTLLVDQCFNDVYEDMNKE